MGQAGERTAQFLRQILPDTGPYTYSVRDEAGELRGRRDVLSLRDLLQALADNSARGASIALASFKGGSHTREDVHQIRSWVVDFDPGPLTPWTDANDAHAQCEAVVAATGLHKPSYILSGRGLHAYFSVDEHVDGPLHQQVGTALLNLFHASGLPVDRLPTPAPAFLMRAPLTRNEKSGTLAKVLSVGERVGVQTFIPKLATYWPKPAPDQTSVTHVTQRSPDVSTSRVVKLCGQMRSAIEAVASGKAGRAVRRPLVQTLTFCKGGREQAHHLLGRAPGYDADKVDTVLDEGEALSGPIKCATWEQLNPGGCKGCSFLGRIATPVEIGSDLPPGFERRDGRVWKVFKDEEPVLVCRNNIRFVSYGAEDGPQRKYRIHLLHDTPLDGSQEVSVSTGLLSGKKVDLLATLGDQGVVPNDKAGRDAMDLLMRGLYHKALAEQRAEICASQLGWRDDGSFVLGDQVHLPDGSVRKAILGRGAKTKKDVVSAAGTEAEWLNGVRAAHDSGLLHLPFALLLSLSAPLWRYLDYAGCTFCFYHRKSGTGKTLALKLANSVYGHPERLLTSVKSSSLAIAHNLGILQNLPMTIDEVTLAHAGLMNEVVLQVSQGSDKERMFSVGGMRETLKWRTILLLTSNTPVSVLLMKGKEQSRAQGLRVIDLVVPPTPNVTHVAGSVLGHIMHSYGHFGVKWIRHLVALGPDQIGQAKAAAEAELDELVGAELFLDSERFWRASMVGALLAGRLSAALLPFDPVPAVRWGVQRALAMRDAADDLEPDCFDLVAEYVAQHENGTVRVGATRKVKTKTSPEGGLGDWKPHVTLQSIRATVRVRMEYEFEKGEPFSEDPPVAGTLYINRADFQQWCAKRGENGRDVRASLVTAGVALPRYEAKGVTYNLTKGTEEVRSARVPVIAMRMETHPVLEGLLDLPDDTEE